VASRRGKFGTGTAPFGGGAPLSDLSFYNIGGATAAPAVFGGSAYNNAPPAGYDPSVAGWSVTIGEGGKMTYAPPPKPTVAPPATSFYGSLVLPVPTLPEAMVPGVSYVPEETFGQQWQGER
jgi:hypothetical protein